jgi:hypothetical protein
MKCLRDGSDLDGGDGDGKASTDSSATTPSSPAAPGLEPLVAIPWRVKLNE